MAEGRPTIGPGEVSGSLGEATSGGLVVAKATDHRKPEARFESRPSATQRVIGRRGYHWGRDGVSASSEERRLQKIDAEQQGAKRSSLASGFSGELVATSGRQWNSPVISAPIVSNSLSNISQSKSNSSKGDNNHNNLTEISSSSSSSSTSRSYPVTSHQLSRNPKPNIIASHQEEGPLIHTDKYNASSPILYVFHSPSARHSRFNEPMGDITISNNPLATSSFPPSRVAVLSAVGKRAIDDEAKPQHYWPSTTIGHQQHNYTEPLVPRFVVLNLEVSGSTASLAWSLSLVPSSKEDIAQPLSRMSVDNEEKTTSENSKTLAQQQTPTQQKQVTGEQRDNGPKDRGEGQVGSHRGARAAIRPADRVGMALLPDPTKREAAASSRAGGGARVLVKRDTIKVVATLRRDPSADIAAYLNKSSNHRYKKAMTSAELIDDQDDTNSDNENEQPDKREMDSLVVNTNKTVGSPPPTTGVKQTIDSNSDLLRIATNNTTGNELQRSASRPTSTTIKPNVDSASSSSSALPVEQPSLGSDLPVGRRLQLSRLQALPANTNNRRPPMRTNTAGSVSSHARGKLENSGSLLPKIDDLPSNSSTKSHLSDEESLSSSPSSSSTTTTTTTSTTSAPSVATVASQTPTEIRRQSRPTMNGLFVSRRKTMDRQSTGLSSSTSTSTNNATATSAPSQSLNFPSAPLRANSPPIIRTASVPLNRIQTAASSTTESIVASSTSSTTSAPVTTRKSLATEQRAPKSLSGFATDSSTTSTSTTPVTTLVTEGSTSSATDGTESSTGSSTTAAPVQTTTTTLPTEASIQDASTPGTSPAPEVTTKLQSSLEDQVSQATTRERTDSANLVPNQQEEPLASKASPPSSPASEQVEVSKWLVRLRRFASNEVDIVKVVVNNLKQFAKQLHQQNQPLPLRYIVFKNLEPSSAYEICIESASPNQQVEDKFRILDANPFLKCHDTSDVELSNMTDSSQPSGTTIGRMDLNSTTGGHDEPLALPLVAESTAEDFSTDSQTKMKSLCKEFFTLPSNSQDKINYGQFESSDSKLNRIESAASSVISRKVKPPIEGSLVETSSSNHSVSTSTTNTTTSNTSFAGSSLRRPKSLQNTLKSHMELLEINDMGSSFGGSREPAPGANMFEILASRSPQTTLNNRLSSLASSNTNQNTDHQHIHRLQAPPGLKRPPTLASNQDYLTLSVLPIVGCVFALIFIITLANIVLSAIKCKSSLRSRRRRAAMRSENRLGGGHGPLARGGATHHSHALGSFYSDNSDNSTTSQSRIVVVGKNKEPFTAASAFFELPDEARERMVGSATEMAHSPQGSGGKLSTSSGQLLSSASRFPLGPSFEGDERHNADMVGLARKNYDNFINHIYNADLADTTNEALHEPAPSRSKSGDPHGHHHYHASNGHYHRHFRQQPREMEPYRLSNGSLGERNEGVTQSLTSTNNSNGTNKKQRLRFDKINPIYNMNGLQYHTSSRNRARSPIGPISSFGHTNQALTPEDHDDNLAPAGSSNRAQVVESTPTTDDQCPLCKEESQHSEQQQQQLNLGDEGDHCDRREAYEEKQQFSCCLDRQKQRFEKQQQQLERVMTKNGSLVPQPFINPTGPPRCGSPSCQAVAHDHDLLVAASGVATKDGKQDVSLVTQSDKSDSETLVGSDQGIATKNDAYPPEGDKPRDFFLFGETDLEQAQTSNSTIDESNQILFPPPPEPPTMNNLMKSGAKVAAGENGGGGKTTIVKLGTMSPGGTGANSRDTAYESINKKDFNQRRNELASKLNLSRPLPNAQVTP